jgi:long-chain acyl-CoA synthetase
MKKNWINSYPQGVPAEINVTAYSSVVDIFEQSCKNYANRNAYLNFGHALTFAELELQSRYFAAFLQQKLQLKKGDRFAIMSPNLLQYPVAMFGALRAGLVIVNVNPLYTARELIHQLDDTGTKAILVVENFASVLQAALPKTSVKHVITTQIADLLPQPKAWLMNAVIKHIKRMVPKWDIPNSISLKRALQSGAKHQFTEVRLQQNDIAFLQGTSGTTGKPKSAILSHGNMVANMQQMSAWAHNKLSEQDIIITALPLYHIFSLTVNCLTIMKHGGCNVLITNPRDIPGFVKELSKIPFTAITGVNTLFNALTNNADFKNLNFSRMHFVVSGGMALQQVVAERWHKITQHPICEGYGLTEASPVVSANLLDVNDYNGSIGLPLPSTDIEIRDDEGNALGIGECGELCVKGPQVMQGYWQKTEETTEVLKDNWLYTGDVARVDEQGYVYIVDRKKNMIVVSGFNVYPNEVEAIISSMPDVAEVAVVGVPDDTSGESVKAFVVKKKSELTKKAIIDYCREHLTRYKIPKKIEFRAELPKNNVGKIMHRLLRDDTKRN